MTAAEILAAIEADPVLLALAQKWYPPTDVIAASLSVGRTKPLSREIGNGTILETVGLTAGNAVLDAIGAEPSYRHVKPLLEQGRLMAASPLVGVAVGALVAGGVITQEQGNALIALGRQPDRISEEEVRTALFAADGTRSIPTTEADPNPPAQED